MARSESRVRDISGKWSDWEIILEHRSEEGLRENILVNIQVDGMAGEVDWFEYRIVDDGKVIAEWRKGELSLD